MDHSWMRVPMMKGTKIQEQHARDLCLTVLLVFAGLAMVGYVEDDENVILLQNRAISTASQQSFLHDLNMTDGECLQVLIQISPELVGPLRENANVTLGGYLNHNAFTMVCPLGECKELQETKHVRWMGRRHAYDKLGFDMQELSLAGETGNQKRSRSCLRDYRTFARDLERMVSMYVGAGEHFIVQEIILRVADLVEVDWIEPTFAYVTRNFAAGKIVLSGSSEDSRLSTKLFTKTIATPLNGSGQVIAIADTGADFDNCMLWQQPFPFPCLGSYRYCFLAQPDFVSFVREMQTRTQDGPLLAGFSLRGDSSMDLLLSAWSEVRPKLLEILTLDSTCLSCGGKIVTEQGIDRFIPKQSTAYEKTDTTPQLVMDTIGTEYRYFSNLMFEKCMCWFTTPSPGTITPVVSEQWTGPSLPALDTNLLQSMCNITRGGGKYPDPRSLPRYPNGTLPGRREHHYQPLQRDLGSKVDRSSYFPMRLIVLSRRKLVWTADWKPRSQFSALHEWWKIYTTVPPYDRADHSRRKLIGYYTFPGCSPCGLCNRVRIDISSFPSSSFSRSLPALLARTEALSIQLAPLTDDWRFDEFAARYTDFSLVMNVDVTVNNEASRQVAQFGIAVCVLSNETFARSTSAQLKDLSYWNTTCLNSQGFQHLLSSSSSSSSSPFKVNVPFYTMASNSTLPKTADGFVIYVMNAASQAGAVSVYVSVRGQLYANSIPCSDKRDGDLLPSFDSRTTKIRSDDRRGVDSVGDANVCADTNKNYCDGSSSSGRQVDLCGVCGGGCFPPACSLSHCISSSSLLARVRFVDQFAAAGGTVSRTFLPAHRCPSDYGSIVPCLDLGCSAALGTCQGRKETYNIDTLLLSLTSGAEFKFPAGSLLVDGRRDDRRWLLTISSFLPIQGIFRNGQDGAIGGVQLSLLPAPAVMLSSAPSQLQVLGTLAELEQALKTFTVTCSSSPNNILDRQRLLRMELQLFLNGTSVNLDGTIGTQCKVGWRGAGCNIVQHRKEIVLSCAPQDQGARFIAPSDMLPGRRPILNRQGHGTHVAASAGGEAYDPVAFPSLPLSTPLSIHNSIASSAKLMVVDISSSSSLYLSPPDSITLLLTRPYNDGARIFLNPWSCSDFRWWKEQETSFSYNYLIAQDASLHGDPQICNRYTIDSRDVDDFVHSHPDLLVIFSAGDSEGGYSSVSSPGTCKNCLTVGMSQLWEQEEVAGAEYLLDQCRPEDCPQLFWEQGSGTSGVCVDSSSSPPSQLASCCAFKYGGDNPETIDYRNQLGFAVSQQGTLTSYVSKVANAPPTYIGNLYTDKSRLKMERVKPELMAPGVNVLSARSDGDPNSGGVRGCRCCMNSGGDDKSSIVALTGSSMSAAQVAAAAALVRSYFEQGFFPLGTAGGNVWSPSAALVKAVLLASADKMLKKEEASGERTDISSLSLPNPYEGFGRLHLLNVIQLNEQTPLTDRCTCLGSNDLLFSPANDPDGKRKQLLGPNYGKTCAPWDKNLCNETLVGGGEPDISCCKSWCWVSPTCQVAIPSPRYPGMFFSYLICPSDLSVLDACPWRNQAVNINVRMLVRDAKIVGAAGEGVSRTFEDLQAKVSPQEFSLSQNDTLLYSLAITGASQSSPFKVTLVYTDPAPALASSTLLVNDLDLSVSVTPITAAIGSSMTMNQVLQLPVNQVEEQTYYGNGKLLGDDVNNVEQVRITQAGPSVVNVTVRGKRVVQGLNTSDLCQTFAIVVSGDLAGLVGDSMQADYTGMRYGICGRPAGPAEAKKKSQVWKLIIAIVIPCFVGLLIFICIMRFLYMKRVRRLAGGGGGGGMEQFAGIKYMSTVTPLECVSGRARGGGLDRILLEFGQSQDGYYVGQTCSITAGPGSEQGPVIITDYDGSTAVAYGNFKTAPTTDSYYTIGNHGRSGPIVSRAKIFDYKVGVLGMIGAPWMPRRTADSSILQRAEKQKKEQKKSAGRVEQEQQQEQQQEQPALFCRASNKLVKDMVQSVVEARTTHGQKTRDQLARLNIG
ncbi:hypothetical protein GUITHDRAFT_145509 [Guillardia theta CCMP2712]|uniref:Peptidase S8/S53 domain-containing protein n=1 Tax=Guillardia theta (strain CCMP2712) TaxID=905079 RepID=L1IKK8_GUITC|nr:hypothetical protein GUITHDRAFT_145509 [Guillardia theta CCMP2712]EKX36768.1 hypothetical protein GUITHDRAFT_145509 [Guillardia theta CCMP2712]|eukprot:XP_005823748.1 hypothetical protein GUITHDRAFT_145509 [Guillardia theta CCMP2712]